MNWRECGRKFFFPGIPVFVWRNRIKPRKLWCQCPGTVWKVLLLASFLFGWGNFWWYKITRCKFSPFTGPESSLPYPQEPSKSPYSEPDPLFILPISLKFAVRVYCYLFLGLAIFSLFSVIVVSPYFLLFESVNTTQPVNCYLTLFHNNTTHSVICISAGIEKIDMPIFTLTWDSPSLQRNKFYSKSFHFLRHLFPNFGHKVRVHSLTLYWALKHSFLDQFLYGHSTLYRPVKYCHLSSSLAIISLLHDWSSCPDDILVRSHRNKSFLLPTLPRPTIDNFFHLPCVSSTSGRWQWCDWYVWVPSHCYLDYQPQAMLSCV